MVSRQALPMPQIGLASMAILTSVAVSSKEEGIGDLTTEAAGNVNELDETDDCRFGENQSFASDDIPVVRLDDLGFPFYYQPEGTPHRDHGERLKRGVQRQTPHADFSQCGERRPYPYRLGLGVQGPSGGYSRKSRTSVG